MLRMKGKQMRYIIAVTGVLIAGAVVLLYPPILSWAAAAAGQVESVSGQVWDIRGKQTFQLASGSVVKPADIIWTGNKGQARLVMSDDSVVVLGPRSRIRIDRYDMDQQGLVAGAFYLLWGKARFLVTKLNNPSSDSFTVSTQTAIIGVRGTEFGVIVPLPSELSEKGESPYTDAMLFKGEIVGKGLKGTAVDMKPGQFGNFSATKPPEVRTMIVQDLQALDIPQLAQGLIEPTPMNSSPNSGTPSLNSAAPTNPGATGAKPLATTPTMPTMPTMPTPPTPPAHTPTLPTLTLPSPPHKPPTPHPDH